MLYENHTHTHDLDKGSYIIYSMRNLTYHSCISRPHLLHITLWKSGGGICSLKIKYTITHTFSLGLGRDGKGMGQDETG